MTGGDPSAPLQRRVDSWVDGEAVGAIAAFEWCVVAATEAIAEGVSLEQVRQRLWAELDRRYPFPNPRRTLRGLSQVEPA